jgi:hypothetical protein
VLLVGRTSLRETLSNAGSARVVKVWRDMLKKLGQEERERELLETAAGDKILMCRKCFSSYQSWEKILKGSCLVHLVFPIRGRKISLLR